MGAIECRQFEEAILGAADVQAELAARPELAEHAAQCAKCGALLAQLQRLETQARGLGVPEARPSPAFLEQVKAMALKRRRALPRVIWIRRSAAAAIILAAGLLALSLYLSNQRSAEAQTVLRDLVSWNLQLTAAQDPAERQRIYQDHAAAYKDRVAHAAMPAGQQKIADGLLQNADWLITENDRLSEAEQFAQLAVTIQSQGQAGGGAVSAQMAGLRNDLISGGVEENLKSVHPDELSAPDRQRFNVIEQEIGSPASAPASGPGTQSGGASAAPGPRGLAADIRTPALVQPLAPLPGPVHIVSPSAGRGSAENSSGSNLLPPMSGRIPELPRNNLAALPAASVMTADPRVSAPPVPQPAVGVHVNPDDTGAMSAGGTGLAGEAELPARASAPNVSDALATLQNSGARSDDRWTASPGGSYAGAIAAPAAPSNFSHDGFAGGAADGYAGGPAVDGQGAFTSGGDGDDPGGPGTNFGGGFAGGGAGENFDGFSGGLSGGFGGSFSSGASAVTNTGIFGGFTSTYGGFTGNPAQDSSHSRTGFGDPGRSFSFLGLGPESITDPTSFNDAWVGGSAPAGAQGVAWSVGGPDVGGFLNSSASVNAQAVGSSGAHNSGQAIGPSGGPSGPSYGKSSGQPGGTTSGSQAAQAVGSQTGQSGGQPSGQQSGEQSGQQFSPGGASFAATGGSGSAGPSSAIAGIAQGDSGEANGGGASANAWTPGNGGYPQTGGGFSGSKGDSSSAGQVGNSWNGNPPASEGGGASEFSGGNSSAGATGSSPWNDGADSSWPSTKWPGSSSGPGISPAAATGNSGNPVPEPGAGLLLVGGCAALLLRRRGWRGAAARGKLTR